MLKELMDAVPSRSFEVAPWWRASMAGACETQLYRIAVGQKGLTLPRRVRHLFDDGHMHEEDIINRLVDAGVHVWATCLDSQVLVTPMKDPLVRGHPDGFLRAPKDFKLDYADPEFRFDRTAYMLEITSSNARQFYRLFREHAIGVLKQKYVQIQLYLNSDEVRKVSDCCVLVVKSKNDSELYEEGISFDPQVVEDTRQKLVRLGVCVQTSELPAFRCDDYRRKFCAYREFCYQDLEEVLLTASKILDGSKLAEASELRQSIMEWRRGKSMEDLGKALVTDTRDLFGELIDQYGVQAITVDDVKGQLITQHREKVDKVLLESKYPKIFDEVTYEDVYQYVMVK